MESVWAGLLSCVVRQEEGFGVENGPLIIAVLGLLSAGVGLITALVGRRKEVVHRHEPAAAGGGRRPAAETAGSGSVVRWLGCSAFVVGGGWSC